jgi:predicted small lipoprotein YifL
MKNLITRGICLALTLVLAFSLTACGGNKPAETTPSTTVAPTTEPTTVPTTAPAVVTGDAMNFFSISYGENYETMVYISIIDNEDGTAAVDYQGEIRKAGNVDVAIFETLAEELAKSGLVELNGSEEWGEGEANGSMFITYADDSILSCGFGGNVPQAFIDGYNYMDNVVAQLLADLPEYVPQATVMGNVDAAVLDEINGLIVNTSMPLDSLVISEAVMDDTFSFVTGLSTNEGIASGASCSSMMMTTAFSLVVVTVEDEANIGAVRADFEANMDWRKWVCVQPTGAVIAQKGNMVICVMAMDETYSQVKGAINASGWTEVATFENPDL